MYNMVTLDTPLDGDLATAEYLGGKGYGLWWMQSNGVNVPPAVIIPTAVCVDYMKDPLAVRTAITQQIPAIKEHLTAKMGYLPLVSVRSGARVSMPGMMDTILNVGLTPDTVDLWVTRLGEACTHDSLARLDKMYLDVVGVPCPATFEEQLIGAIEAVFNSWDNDRAKFYRKMNNIPEDWGTAVVIQAMVFGNLNDQSGTGVLFTRDPDTGNDVITGEFLVNAQGEDVVAGIRTPMPLSQMSEWNPGVTSDLLEAVTNLEKAKKDVQDVEFTIQDGVLYILQTRNAKRSAKAAVRIAVDMYHEGVLPLVQALKRVTIRQFDLAQQRVIDPSFKDEPDLTGIPACSGVVTGRPVFSSIDAINCIEPCILVTKETTPNDIAGMDAAVGVLTMMGGATSHAAVVARGMNKPCVVGVGAETKDITSDVISIDGATGRVWFKDVPVIDGAGDPYVVEYTRLLCNYQNIIPVDCLDLGDKNSVILLDVGSDLHNLPLAVERVVTALKNPKNFLYVDCRSTGRHGAWESFSRMFDAHPDTEGTFLKLLAKGATPTEMKRVRVLTDTTTELPRLRAVHSLEVFITAEEDHVALNIPPDYQQPAFGKVLNWRKKEGLLTISLVSSVEGSPCVRSIPSALHRLNT